MRASKQRLPPDCVQRELPTPVPHASSRSIAHIDWDISISETAKALLHTSARRPGTPLGATLLTATGHPPIGFFNYTQNSLNALVANTV